MSTSLQAADVARPGLRLPRPLDTVSVLTLYLVLLFAIPTDLRIPALGGAGSLSTLVALGCGMWWCYWHLQRSDGQPGLRVHPVRVAALLFLAAVLASYVAAASRPIDPGELSQADIGVLRTLASVSVLLLAVDALPSLTRLRDLLERFAWVGAGLAALGLTQFVTGRSFVDSFSLPGMASTQTFTAVVDRGGFTRSAGTAMSPLEYGAALSAAFPLALTFAFYGSGSRRGLRWLAPGLIGAALLVSGSRSAILGLVVGLVVLFPAWSAAVRARMAVLGVFAVVGVFFLVPGMIGTLRYLFTQTSGDASAQSRSNSYDIVAEFVARSPVFGRGFGTFLPQYRILDNQYLLLLIEVGVVGTLAFVAITLTAAAAVATARVEVDDPLTAQLGQALAASVASVAVLAAFFDALSFPLAGGCFFLAAGLCGGYYRLVRSRAG